jgi:hypothetical protein
MQDDKKHKGYHFKKEHFLPYTRENYILFAAGILVIIAGYVALSKSPWNSFASLNIAPVLLVLGYCVLIPVSILYQKKKSKPAEQKQAAPAAQETPNP